jgi:hypothetical protein
MSFTKVKILGIEVDVEYEYYYDPGVWTYSNGDPGYPESSELDITSLYVGTEDISKWLDIDAIFTEVYEQVSNQIDKHEGIEDEE